MRKCVDRRDVAIVARKNLTHGSSFDVPSSGTPQSHHLEYHLRSMPLRERRAPQPPPDKGTTAPFRCAELAADTCGCSSAPPVVVLLPQRWTPSCALICGGQSGCLPREVGVRDKEGQRAALGDSARDRETWGLGITTHWASTTDHSLPQSLVPGRSGLPNRTFPPTSPRRRGNPEPPRRKPEGSLPLLRPLCVTPLTALGSRGPGGSRES